GRGLHFVTWQYNYDRSGMDHGHYTEDYAAAKEDFAVRSGLFPEAKLFMAEQAADIIASVKFRLENDGCLSFPAEERLYALADKLSSAYPAIRGKAENTLTSEVINGSISAGDWVVVATGGAYGYLVGQVIEITPLGSAEHDTGNAGDDIHVNFMEADYSDERKREIIDQLGKYYGSVKPFGVYPLDDVIMPPDALIRLSGPENARFGRLAENREAARTYCNKVMASLKSQQPNENASKLKTLAERLNAADEKVKAQESALGGGQREISKHGKRTRE
ncbi:MAG: hypothetical protein LBS19_06545, partial [Clostridiales bacterium]|nr:hypothetical protein [Clostridiales bacterium]